MLVLVLFAAIHTTAIYVYVARILEGLSLPNLADAASNLLTTAEVAGNNQLGTVHNVPLQNIVENVGVVPDAAGINLFKLLG